MSDTKIQIKNYQVQFYKSVIKENHKKLKMLYNELKEVKDYLNNEVNNGQIYWHLNFKNFLEDRIKGAKELIKICSAQITKYTC